MSLSRPDVPGLAVDMQFALQRAQFAAQLDAAAAAQATQNGWLQVAQSFAAPAWTAPRPVTCISRVVVRDTVYTSCQ
jgi:hypothetical protein